MLVMDINKAPILTENQNMYGMVIRDGVSQPGKILELWKQLRESTGIIEAKAKTGVKFKVRSSEDLIDKIREKANELGILIYPTEVRGVGHVVDSGTLADVQLKVVAQAVEDGSMIQFAGFGLGADQQDKAGGKAGTYAFKQALIQALLAGGAVNAKPLGVVDTDDSDSPIPGGVKPARAKAPGVDEMRAELALARSKEQYTAALQKIMTMAPAFQLELRDAIIAAKAAL